MDVKTTIQLTEREEAFVLNLARGMRPTKAAKEAGWSVASARHLMQKPHMQSAIRSVAANLAYSVRCMDQAA